MLSVGVGCCSLKEGEILDADRKKVRVKDINKEKIYISSYNFSNCKVEKDIAEFVDSGNRMIYQIEFDDKSKLYFTEEHRFFVSKDGKIIERKLKQLKVGDKLATL
jgi:intein/homing endonuclease